MFDPAAPALLSTMPSALPPVPGLTPETSGNAAPASDGTAGSGPVANFAMLLSLQIPTAPATPAILPHTGKILPDAAKPVAAALPLAVAEPLSAPAAAETGRGLTPQEADASDPRDAVVESGDPALVTIDPALVAAILAAPHSLATAHPAQDQRERLDQRAAPAAPATKEPAVAPASPQSAVAQPVPAAMAGIAAIARTAVIETDITDAPAAPEAPVTQAQAFTAEQRPQRPARERAVPAGTTATGFAAAAPEPASSGPSPAPAPTSDEHLARRFDAMAAPDAAATATASPNAPAPDTAGTATLPRAQARVERMDFATLVDTLSRAREEASPRSVRVAVTHADFGKVSLRFDQDDKGLSVAMSSADPGFARAATAPAESAALTDRNAQSNSEQRNPEPRGGNAAGGTPAQNGGQPETGARQQPGTRTGGFAANGPAPQGTTAPRDDGAAPTGIYA